MSSNCRVLFTLTTLSSVGEIVAFVSKYPKGPRGNVILYGELLYTCEKIMSEFVFFVYLMDAIIKCIKWCISADYIW